MTDNVDTAVNSGDSALLPENNVENYAPPAVQPPIDENESLCYGITPSLALEYKRKIFCQNVGLGVAIVATLFIAVLYLKKIQSFRELAAIKTFNRGQLLTCLFLPPAGLALLIVYGIIKKLMDMNSTEAVLIVGFGLLPSILFLILGILLFLVIVGLPVTLLIKRNNLPSKLLIKPSSIP